MTVFTRTWNSAYEASPPDNQDISLGATRIREVKADVQERGEVDHSWAGTVDDGMHKKVTLVDPLGSKPTQANDETYLYSKDVSAKAELFFEDEDGDEIQLTTAGSINALQTVNNGDWSGTDLSVANGGTGASTARTAQQGIQIWTGLINASGPTFEIKPTGWTLTHVSTGVYRITHNYGSTAYTAVIGAYTSVTAPLLLSHGSTFFTVHSYDLAGNLADGGFSFIMMGTLA